MVCARSCFCFPLVSSDSRCPGGWFAAVLSLVAHHGTVASARLLLLVELGFGKVCPCCKLGYIWRFDESMVAFVVLRWTQQRLVKMRMVDIQFERRRGSLSPREFETWKMLFEILTPILQLFVCMEWPTCPAVSGGPLAYNRASYHSLK